jgi:hypothetical protein
MDRVGLDDIEREIDSEARERFPGGAMRQVVLLQYGDDPEIEPGDLWVRVLLAADGPDDYERSMREFQHDHEAAMEQFADRMAGKLREISQVEFTPENRQPPRPRPRPSIPPGGQAKACRRAGVGTRGEDGGGHAHHFGPLGPGNPRHADHAGIAETRADAIRWALARIRERPAYERLRERIQEIDQLRTDF